MTSSSQHSAGRTARDALPGRRTCDPWPVLNSEMMLTQTHVSRVANRFEPFIEQFSTSERCADAELSSVLRAWSGPGCNRRAKSLHETARKIVTEFSGRVPSRPADLELLSGIGPYIARIVAAFAYDEDVAPIDSSLRRVFERAISG